MGRTCDSPDIQYAVRGNHCCLVLRVAHCKEIVAERVSYFHPYYSRVLVVCLKAAMMIDLPISWSVGP